MKMTPLVCACAVVITLETQKCRKRAPRSVEFNFFINCDRHKRFSQNERRRADLQNVASDFLILPRDLVMKYTFSPAELSSERGEKEVLADSNQPTAPPSTKSHVSYCAACARRREKMAAEGTSSTTGWSLLQSVLVSAVDSCHCPHPSHPSTALLPIAPLSLFDQVWCIQRCDCVNCT